jgi:hypothetical protein
MAKLLSENKAPFQALPEKQDDKDPVVPLGFYTSRSFIHKVVNHYFTTLTTSTFTNHKEEVNTAQHKHNTAQHSTHAIESVVH